MRVVISSRIHDYSNGYRFYTRGAAQRVVETHIVYGSPIYLTKVMAIWVSHGLRVADFPSHYMGRNEGLSKLRIIDLIKASLGIFEIASRLHVRGFSPADRAADSSISSHSPVSSKNGNHNEKPPTFGEIWLHFYLLERKNGFCSRTLSLDSQKFEILYRYPSPPRRFWVCRRFPATTAWK